jgi:glycosyltransferase involved in cell wall biosynthesis
MSKISILCANLSSNALGRAYLLARVLQRNYDVEVLGPTFNHGIWPPCDTGEFTYQAVHGCNFPRFFLSIRDLLQRARGDVIYAVKPRLSSFGVGLLIKRTRGIPLVLDIDDWDYAGDYTLSRLRRLISLVVRLHNPYANQYLLLMEKFLPQADAITVVSSPLQRRFGGVLVSHGRDTDYLDPSKYSGKKLRQIWELDDHTIIMFLGTPRPHKGLEDLIAAVDLLSDLPIALVIVGADPKDSYTARLRAQGKAHVHLLEMQPFSEIPNYLAAADIVALPQRDIPFAHAQVPAKVFDAMAMAKPIIATNVGDLPIILGGCGIIVPPGDIHKLSEAIRQITSNRDLAQEMGREARQRCIEGYSWDIMEQQLDEVFKKISD